MRTMVYLAIVAGFLIIAANVFTEAPPARNFAVVESSPKLEVPAPRITPVSTTETLFTLNSVNVHSGPGKDYKVVDRLEPFVEVTVEKEAEGEWRKLVIPSHVSGYYVFASFVGTRKEAQDVYVEAICEAVNGLERTGHFIKVDGSDIYVNEFTWLGFSQEWRKNFPMNYAAALKTKTGHDVLVRIMDPLGNIIAQFNTEF